MKSRSKLWNPPKDLIENSAMAVFRRRINHNFGLSLCGFLDLHDWSIKNIGEFWEQSSDFLNLKWARMPKHTYTPPAKGKMIGGKWFGDGKLNFAQNLLPDPNPDKIIISSYCEGRELCEWSAFELHQRVALCAISLKKLGVKKGDRVAGVLANIPEAIVAMLGVASIGAVWSSCSPDFGLTGICDRFEQIEPVVVFYTPRYIYGGRNFNNDDVIEGCKKKLLSVKAWICIDHLDGGNTDKKVSEFFAWNDFLGDWRSYREPLKIDFEAVSFDHPLYIMFSSGTTGVPKCIVHGTGGTLLQHKKELVFHCDLKEGDNLLFFTTCGWMMWNWMVSALSTGARLSLFEGSITSPDPEILWRTAASLNVSVLGVSPRFLSFCMGEKTLLPAKDLTPRLRCILTTGAPLLPEHFDWIYQQLESVQLSSISGGTDILSCFVLGNPLTPVFRGEIQGLGLGMAVEAWDDMGRPVLNTKGELVCVKPFVSMPLGFWKDQNGERYRDAYFNFYSGLEVWRHADHISIDSRGGVVIYGRSDSTLNPGGVRIGSSEIYRVVETIPEIRDSIVIGQDWLGDSRILLFVVLAEDVLFDKLLELRIRQRLKAELSPRHVPALIFSVKDIPYTRSGKKVEIAVRNLFNGCEIENIGAIQNVEVLEEYQTIALALK